MSNNPKRSVSLLSLIVTVAIVLGGLSLGTWAAYKTYRKIKQPKRYDTTRLWSQVLSDAQGVRIVVASSLERIFQDGQTLVEPRFRNLADLALAGNEYESFQIAVASGREPLQSVGLEISDLVNGPSGARLDGANVTWRVVGYVPTIRPYYPVKFVGPWPDPLLPEKRMDIPAQRVQPFWVTVYIPPKTPAGDYQGWIYLKSQTVLLKQIPFSVKVYDFVLPQTSHLRTAFDFYGHITRARYPQGQQEHDQAYQSRIDELNDKFLIEMLRTRMNPVLNIDPTSPEDLSRLDRYRWFGLTQFSVGRKGGTFNNNWPQSDSEIEGLLGVYRSYGENLKLHNLLSLHYIYTWDEGTIGDPRVAKISSMIHRAYPGLKNMVCYHGFWDPHSDPDWGKDIDIWTFQIDHFDERKINALREKGMEIWMYISGPGGYSTPNLAMDFDSMDYRIVPWLCWKYNITGFLYWCVNWWPKVDPFQSAANTDWAQNGNGLLFYPGENGPLGSIRSELFRDGMEDYEYLSLLKEKMREVEKMGPPLGFDPKGAYPLYVRTQALLAIDKELALGIDHFTKDSQVLYRVRDTIAKTIEEWNQYVAEQSGKARGLTH